MKTKAYKLNRHYLDTTHESVFMGYIPEYFYAENEKDARWEALKIVHDHDIKDYCDNEITYISCKVKRAKEFDKILVDGVYKTQIEINRDKEKQLRLNFLQSILDDENITHCYIIKRGTYYRPNSCGYTEFKLFAGIYPKKEAVSDGISCQDLTIEPINVLEHNEYLNKHLTEIKSRLI